MTSPRCWLPFPIHLILFLVLLSFWTYMLVKPTPVPESLFDGISWFDVEMLKFILSKMLHFCSYAFMTLLGGTLSKSQKLQNGIFYMLFFHGVGTEIAQYVGNLYFETHRFGSGRDVLIDTAGIVAGILLLRRFDKPAIQPRLQGPLPS